MIFLLENLSQGLLYAILAIGVVITYKVLDFADLSVEGTAPLGGVVCAMFITQFDAPILALVASFIVGMLAGWVTGLLHVKLKITGLLSGIMVMTALYSINLLIGTSSNIPVYNYNTIFSSEWLLEGITSLEQYSLFASLYNVVVLLFLVFLIKIILDLFFKTKLGYLMKITGDNPDLVDALGESVGKIKILGISLSNGITALFGAVAVQLLGYYEISMGSGMIVAALASVILGTTIFKKMNRIKLTTMAMIGAMLYRFTIAFSYRLDLPTSFEKIITVAILLIAIAFNQGEWKRLLQKGRKQHVETRTYQEELPSR